jgi:hypothetical protein
MMKLIITFPFILAFLFGFFTVTTPLMAQELPACEVLSVNEDGTYLIRIGNETLLAITKEIGENALKTESDLKAALKELALMDSLIATYKSVENKYEFVLKQQKDYIADSDSLLEGYKKLAKGYKKLSGEPWVTFSGGVGATGSNDKPVVLAGVGIRRFRVWGFLQESNGGIIAGLAFPLF